LKISIGITVDFAIVMYFFV